MCPKSLPLSAPYNLGFLKAAFLKGLMQTPSPSMPPIREFHQGNAKTINAQCFTELPWLCLLFLLLRMVPYARLLKPVFSAFKSFQTCQGALKVPKRDPYLPLQVPIPPLFYL